MVTGMATSYDLPQYIGELFQKGEKPNAFLRMVGGLTGGIRLVTTPTFAMGVDYSLPAADATGKIEGANPSPKEQDTNQSTNIVQIFQEAVQLTYSAQAATGVIAGLAAIPGVNQSNGELISPRSIEWQRARAVERVARNANVAFLKGAFVQPGNNATARQTRGVRTAVTTNVFANGGTNRAISKVILESALQAALGNGMFNLGDELVVLCDASQYAAAIGLYEGGITQLVNPGPGATVAGVAVKTIATKWATLQFVWEPDMNPNELFICQPKYCRVVGMPIGTKGVLFSEPLSKTGSADTEQVYGELGIDYRNEIFHAVVKDLS